MAVADLLYSPIVTLRSYVGSVAWGPVLQLSKTTIISLFQQIEHGQLTLVDHKGRRSVYGKQATGPCVELQIHKDVFWIRMLLFADMGFAESFMLGEFSCSNLTAFFEIFILNRSRLSNGTTLTSSLSGTIAGLARSTNTLANSRLNIQAHYDISNDMFAAFLSPDMTYSCPIWATPASPGSSSRKSSAPEETLEHAQQTKLAYFIAQARLKRSDHVLEIGTGWGSFAIAAVRATGCRVTSITLSVEQKALAEQRIADAGFTDNIEVLLCDYRALPTPKAGRYDKIVSIEMLEAVGAEFLHTYFECVHKLLKPDGGIAVFQCITMPETRYAAYQSSTDFIRRYIFPGGHLPTVSQLVATMVSGSGGALIVDGVRNIGPHYARTLRAWREAFNGAWEARIRPALLRDHAGMTDGDAELFRRKWEYYFAYCEAGFATCTLGDVIITVGREGAMELAEGVTL